MTVQDVLNLALGRLTGPATCTIFDAVREVQGIIVHRLLARKSELLQNETDAQLIFAAYDNREPLPVDFLTLAGRPFISGIHALAPLSAEEKSGYTVPGTPTRYEIIGRTLRVHPTPVEAVTVYVPYFSRPPIPTALTDELPFYGAFDGAFVEGTMGLLSMGLSAVADAAFVGMIAAQVDEVLAITNNHNEQLLADAINGI